MRVINITQLSPNAKQEIVKDLYTLNKECGVTDVAFIMSLHVESLNLLEKVQKLCEYFLEMRKALIGLDLKVGILVQSLIGHGERGRARMEPDFQRVVSIEGKKLERSCPLGEDFRQYVKDVFKLLSATEPDFFLIDDDFELFGGGKDGCFCEKHLAAFNISTKRQMDFDNLLKTLEKQDETSLKIGRQWNDTLIESMVSLSKIIRESIDSVNEDIPCGYAASMVDLSFLSPIAKALAGKNRPFIRANGACYLLGSPVNLAARMRCIAIQAAYLKDIPEILVEADTFPHNRYSCSALFFNCYVTSSLLCGVNGVMQWITRNVDCNEPEAGLAYRDILRKHQGFYEQLSLLTPHWQGVGIPLPRQLQSSWNPPIEHRHKQIKATSWYNVISRMGFPWTIGEDMSVNMLSGDEIDFFSDAELLELCQKSLILDGGGAVKMCERGFSEYIGVDVKKEGMRVSYEQILDDPEATRTVKLGLFNGAFDVMKITALDQKVEILSKMMLNPWTNSPNAKYQAPGLTLFKNQLGGQAAVFAVTINDRSFGAFPVNFLNETRKKQLVRLLMKMNEEMSLPVLLDDVDLFVRYGKILDGSNLLCVFNLNLDALPALRLQATGYNFSEMHLLLPSGEWEKLNWKTHGNKITVDTQVKTMQPLIIKLIMKD